MNNLQNDLIEEEEITGHVEDQSDIRGYLPEEEAKYMRAARDSFNALLRAYGQETDLY